MNGGLTRGRHVRPAALGGAWLAALALVLVGSLLPTAALAEHWAPPSTVYVERTGHTADGLFLDVWREQRDLLGDPITEEFRVRTGRGADPDAEQIVQYYEHGALAYLPGEAPGEQVRMLDLGGQALERALAAYPSLALRQAVRRTACGAGGDGCLGFARSGHMVGREFQDAWSEAGGERFLGQPLTESFRAADGSRIQYFEGGVLRRRAGQEAEPLPIGVAAAKRLKLGTAPVARPAEIPAYEASLFVAPPEPEPAVEAEQVVAPEPELAPEPVVVAEPPVEEPVVEPEPALEPSGVEAAAVGWPGPQVGEYKEIVVSISAQTLWAYEGGQLVNSTLVSTGTAEVPETVTPLGTHRILTKYEVQDMEGTISDEYYFVPDVPSVMYFDNLGNALHGTYWHSNFGTPMSHGCVNLPLDVAAWMYAWAPIGTAVTVIP